MAGKICIDQSCDKPWFEGEPHQQYTCLICNANIAHKYSNISSHLNLIHDLSIQEYEERCLVLKRSDVSEEECYYMETEAGPELRQGDDQGYEFTEADIIIEGEQEEASEGAEGEDCEVAEAGAADSEHAWYHGSNLTCQICSKTFANDQWYFHHFSKIHGMTKEQYNEQYGKELEVWHQYQCLICNSEIRWKYSSIRQHLKQVHDMTIQDYEARYMDAEAKAEAVDSVEAVTNLCSEVSPPATPVLQSSLLPPPPPLQCCGSPPALKASPAAAAAALAGRKLHASSPPSLTMSPSLQLSQAKGSMTFEFRPIAEDKVGLVETPGHRDTEKEQIIVELIQRNLSLEGEVNLWKRKFKNMEEKEKKSTLTSVKLWKLLMQEHKNSLRIQREEREAFASASARKQKKSEKKKKKKENDRSKERDKEERRRHRRNQEEKDWREYRRWCEKIDEKLNADWAEYVAENERRIAEEDERRVARHATEDDSSEQGEDDEDTQTPEGDWDDYQDNEDQESQDEDTQTPEGDWDDNQDNEDQDQDQDQYREDEECGDEDVGGDEGEKYDGKYFNDEEFPAEATQS